ncbi:MAG: T9SS type A sorting domain-containing protein [Saprospiraceae bacterium]|nr:T9SS type A sorting domain-containing protein [Saprospiraceae bacterium]
MFRYFDFECDMGYTRPDCTSNPYSVDNLCDVAYNNPLCDVSVISQFACGQIPSELGPWAGKQHCGGTYENTSFYGFIAGTGDYSIEFIIFSCAGTGVEYGLIDACNPDGPYIVCNGNANSGTVTVDASQLEPCKKYIFWMDGFSGSICSYYISVIGDFNVCEVPAVQDITINQACNLPCPNLATLPVTVVGANDIENIDNVILHWDISFNGAPLMITTTTPVNDGMSIDVPFLEAGIYEICVVTEHPCPGLSAPFCKTFEFKSPNITSKEYNLCIDDFPWNVEVDSLTGLAALDEYGNPWKWSGGPIELSNINTTPPTYSFSSNYVDTCGCAYLQNIKFNILSSSQQRYDVCYKDLPFSIGDTLINTEVTSLPIYINNTQDTLSCDSIIYLSLQIFNEGEPCDDKDASTINDVYDAACVCKGEKSNNVDNTSKDAWVVYPNPVTETLIISNTSTQFTIPDIEIYYIQGISIKPIIKENIGQQPKLELETTALPPGVYHLKIKTNQDMTIKRFVKI